MNINDKIAARRREVELERQKVAAAELARQKVEHEVQQAAAAEIARQKVEHEAQQDAVRIAELKVAPATAKKQKVIEMPSYMISPIGGPLLGRAAEEDRLMTSVAAEPWSSRSKEVILINNSLERVTKRELFIFLMLVAISALSLFRVEMGRTLFFGIMALIYIAYVLKKHRDEIVVMGKKISEEASKEM